MQSFQRLDGSSPMFSDANDSGERDRQLSEVLVACLEAVDQGRPLLAHEWLARYPEFGAELSRFFAGQEKLERLAGPLRSVFEVGPGQTPAPDSTPLPGHPDIAELSLSGGADISLGDYQLQEEIGRGGMGVVYKALHKRLNRLVALKCIRGGALGSAAEVQRFRNEAEMVAQLDHPHIVPIYEVGEWGGGRSAERGAGSAERGVLSNPAVPYFTMKLIEGGSLATQLSDYGPDSRAAAQLVATVARAVHHAHQRGILHRDLKPSNILLQTRNAEREVRSAHGARNAEEAGSGEHRLGSDKAFPVPRSALRVPYVTDFGLAKRVEVDGSLTQSGVLVGTPSYMAPEQASGKKGAITTATDVHGLGAILYALLTGRPPFQGDTVLDTLEQVKDREPESPSRSNPRVDRDLETICLKCLQKEPARRYGSAQELADDLEHWLAGEPIQARPLPRVARAWRWCRRHKAIVSAGAVVLLAVGSVGWVLGDRAARQREAEGKVWEALAAAEPGLRQGNPWDPALISAVQRAEAHLNRDVVTQGLWRRVEQLQKDVQMLTELERIRLDRVGVQGDRFDLSGSDPQYAKAFREYGINVETLGEAPAFIQNSSIRAHLVAGLEDWANVLPSAGKDATSRQAEQLLAVARQVDPDPWRNRLRDMLLSRGRRDLEQLARSAPIEELPAAALGLLGRWVANEATRSAEASGPTVQFLRRAQQRFPADFWINEELAYTLAHVESPRLEQAIGFYRAAVALRPQSPGVHLNLGKALGETRDLDGAIAEFREAIKLKNDYAAAHRNLGGAFLQKGDRRRAIAEFREAIQLKNDYAAAHDDLGNTLRETGDVDAAIAEYREALRINKDFASAHNNLGTALHDDKGRPDEAIAEFRQAIRINKDFAIAHNNLGTALANKGRLDEAIAEFREAIRTKKGYAEAHCKLGNALFKKGQLEDSIAEFRSALRINKDYAEAHNNLGTALANKGQFDEAIAEYREALRVNKDLESARNNLAGAVRLVALDARLPAVLRSESVPVSRAERIEFAELCTIKQRTAAAARFYAEAFAAQPELADDLEKSHRYNAACAAAKAGTNQGIDAADLDEEERASWRRQALEWLRADLRHWAQLAESASNPSRLAVQKTLAHWQADPDLAGVRGEPALAKLPEAEREAWRTLWTEVATTLAKIEGKAGPENKEP
jgi:serine/threonine-protein kinase